MPDTHRRQLVGRIVSNKMQKTVVVAVDKTRTHRLYKRTMRVTRKYYAHDETDALNVGDLVRIIETRPLSRLKRWRVAEVVRKSAGSAVAIAEPEEAIAPTPAPAAAGVVGAVAEAAATVAATAAEAVLDVAEKAVEAATPATPAEETPAEEPKPRTRRRRATKAEDEAPAESSE